jgi:hypothetical protein
MNATPTAIPYDDALDITGAEFKRIWDWRESFRPEDEYDEDFVYAYPEYEHRKYEVWEEVKEEARGMMNQMIWTLAKVYGLEYEEVEGDIETYL